MSCTSVAPQSQCTRNFQDKVWLDKPCRPTSLTVDASDLRLLELESLCNNAFPALWTKSNLGTISLNNDSDLPTLRFDVGASTRSPNHPRTCVFYREPPRQRFVEYFLFHWDFTKIGSDELGWDEMGSNVSARLSSHESRSLMLK